MPTPLRHLCSVPAEIARSTAGPAICHDFKLFDAAECYKNGLSMVGTVPVRRRIGAIYSGVAGNYWQLNNVGGRVNKAVLNIVIEFWPEFSPLVNETRFLMDSTDTTRYIVVKNPAAAYNLEFYVNATAVLTSAGATYSPYWNMNGRNVLVISALSGTNTMWLNGISIATSVVAWTPQNPSTIYYGTRFSAQFPYYGNMGMVKIFTGNVAADLFTLADAQAYWKNEI